MKHIVVVVLVAVSALPAFAQSNSSSSTPTKAKTPAPIIIDLDGDVIEASPQRPAAIPVVAGPSTKKHPSLIRLRTDFRSQVLSSVSRL